ncbi:unnamed protein product [Leptidea sinapis]|uniref:Peptidase S1 domain-containing protein n=1 Tax=Leptidea sinapis TaxID=189913 RepID=A0A5E4PM98_9NEOP|nr:unnamed protein product [Leptidea sinapis]
MRVALLACIIYIFIYEYSCYNDVHQQKYPIFYKNIKIFNPGKYAKLKYHQKNSPGKINKPELYTAFNRMYDVATPKHHGNVFVEVDHLQNQPRVKKILGDYGGHAIHKRSVDIPENNNDTRRKSGRNNNINKKSRRETVHKRKIKKRKRVARNRNVTHVHKHKMLRNDERRKRDKKIGRAKEKIIKRKKSSKSKSLRQKKSKRSRPRAKSVDKSKTLKNQQKDKTDIRVVKAVEDGRRLIAARDARIEDYPYVVSIQKSGEHWCSGALLNQRLIVTTANCIWKSHRVSRMRVRAGSRYLDRGGQTARIQEVMRHPDWSIRRNPDCDVGLVLLDRNIRFSDTVHGVDLPNNAMLPPFDDAWVTSWGAERRDGIYVSRPMTLQVFHTRLLEHAKCNNVTERFGVTRDTGAPAVSDGILWGVASWGIRKLCGTERFPAMFSYLASKSNLDFLTNGTQILMSDKRHYPYPDNLFNNRAETTPPSTTS